jgi:hypothetical protein
MFFVFIFLEMKFSKRDSAVCDFKKSHRVKRITSKILYLFAIITYAIMSTELQRQIQLLQRIDRYPDKTYFDIVTK